MEETQSLQQVVLESGPALCKSMKLEYSLTLYSKINQRQYKIWHQNILKREHRQNIFRHKSQRYFLRFVSQGKINESKNKSNLIELTRFYTAKKTINNVKKQCMDSEKILNIEFYARFFTLLIHFHQEPLQFHFTFLPFEWYHLHF